MLFGVIVSLLEGEIGWVRNIGEKIGRKIILKHVWLSGDEGK